MAEDHWAHVVQLFNAALEREPGERAAALAAAGADPELRREVESLLAAHEATGPLDRLALQIKALQVDALAAGPIGARSAGPGGEPEAVTRTGVASLGSRARLGRYEIRSHLGSGGMGEVYSAFDTRLQREVAIKVVGRRVQGRREVFQRFEQEARAASAINHPNIVTVHDIGEEASFPYIVMELVEGESLRRMMTGPWPTELLLHLAVQIADALAAAHERRIVHCDVKPENILVTPRGIAKVLDFGIAQFRRLETPSADAARSADRAPWGGVLVGTLGYMPPEVVSGYSPDFRADQFSFAATLYEMATGRRAIAGRDTLEKIDRTLRGELPSLAAARPDLPGSFVDAVVRCLSREPAERFPSTRQLLDELRAARRAAVPGSAVRSEPAGAPLRAALPAQRTPLVGRHRELADIQRLIVEEEARLLTLTGPGGTGKTRLALRAAEELAPRFAGRVFFVPLAAITDADLVAPAIAQALRTTVSGGEPVLSAVVSLLRAAAAPTLLVIDNFEQVIGAATSISELMAACPELSVIVTSREVLRLYGEHDFPVHPLGRPDPDSLPPLAELADYPAVALFVDRFRAANPTFHLRADNAAAVATLCARLDGLPLALELAAAQGRVLSPEAMLSRLERRLDLLTRGPRDFPGRHQTLRRTLDWSHQLLDATEQALFRRLAVFVGGITLEAAQAVADPFGTLGADVVGGLASLVDKSLLQPGEPVSGEPRFSMLETIREYALGKLAASGEEQPTRKAHAAYFLVLAEEGGAALAARDQTQWVERFDADHGNFRSTLDWLTEQGNAEWGLRMALGLFHFWERREYLAEARRRLVALAELERAQSVPALRVRALFFAGALAHTQGDFDAGAELHTRCGEMYEQLGDRSGVALSLLAVGNQYLAARRELGKARSYYDRSLKVWEELGDDAGIARCLSSLASIARMQGRFDEARGLCRKAAGIFERLEDHLGHAWALDFEADVARDQGDLETAQALYEKALAAFRLVKYPWGIGSSLADLAAIARRRGDRARAAGLHSESLASFTEVGYRRGIFRQLEAMACLAAEGRQGERALKLAGAAARLREAAGVPMSAEERAELDRCVTQAEAALDVEAAARARREGQSLSLEEAIRFARNAEPRPAQQ